ncbi:Non-catalytic module family EXPN protein [Schizophyllum amplum]|uniref:Non-catalytic module family EXPN protein n=1 Tax=Schizophyllum amplum TaxID=97359 RepID=A0A550C6S8_9AGAR|nr:Non-catalytic module family EXPN protein [Auriculariopsis ampla]
MVMTRAMLFFITFFAFVAVSLCAPVPEASEIESRIVHHKGRLTWYQPGLGNCGNYDTEDDSVIAISKERYDNSNGGHCDQWIKIKVGNKIAYGKTRDSCPGCGYDDLDLSPAVFKQLGSLDDGVLQSSWHFLGKGESP